MMYDVTLRLYENEKYRVTKNIWTRFYTNEANRAQNAAAIDCYVTGSNGGKRL